MISGKKLEENKQKPTDKLVSEYEDKGDVTSNTQMHTCMTGFLGCIQNIINLIMPIVKHKC